MRDLAFFFLGAITCAFVWVLPYFRTWAMRRWVCPGYPRSAGMPSCRYCGQDSHSPGRDWD